VPTLRLARIHGAVGLFQCFSGFRVGPEDRDSGGSTGHDGMTAEHEAQAIDRLLQRRRLGFGVGLAEIPQQYRELIAAQSTDAVG